MHWSLVYGRSYHPAIIIEDIVYVRGIETYCRQKTDVRLTNYQ